TPPPTEPASSSAPSSPGYENKRHGLAVEPDHGAGVDPLEVPEQEVVLRHAHRQSRPFSLARVLAHLRGAAAPQRFSAGRQLPNIVDAPVPCPSRMGERIVEPGEPGELADDLVVPCPVLEERPESSADLLLR